MKDVNIFRVNSNYIRYLNKFDAKVMYNKDNLHTRPYVGIVLDINNLNYFAPLTSPKPKHEKMKNNLGFMKIRLKDNEYGAVNINNMIPIKEDQLIKFNINDEKDNKYKKLLKNQFKFLYRNADNIHHSALKLYEKVVIQKDINFINMCCDFKVLENKCLEYDYKKTKEKEFSNMVNEHQIWINTNGESGKQINLENKDLKGLKLLNLNLRNINLQNADLRDCIIFADLQSANLKGIKVNENTKWVGSNLKNAEIDKNVLKLIKKQIDSDSKKHQYGLSCLKTASKECAITKE
ncbi:type III toxin-antitoxin system ToxN/AbiQ family toxin [Clostridium senegalense]|uniref:type III toxin-antitoxin system ToxN/AbiQ family toxin n=1 Tax=Clostridium senegalense TaxID=1465809 RepID=UPI001C122C89|nr:type III toxin-antitoxin system ToxN/AbiQ family toxin [Clostridium senegalense]MBU5228151.1 type III toxin-antitoxin system ToxN/AbiQ family toxin [Clostridium senegalense]